jgi:hypothetical protein
MGLFAKLLTRRWAGAMTALLVTAWLAPASAQAGCGDYVAIPGEDHPMPGQGQPSPKPPQQPFSPCTSAVCLPPADMALAGPSNSSSDVDSLAWRKQHGCVLPAPEERLPISMDFHVIQGSPQAIFHPPRP